MDDAGTVRGVERVGDLSGDGDRFQKRQRGATYAIVQRVALDQLEHQGRCVAGVFEAVDCRNVRVIERGEQACFAFEARHTTGVGGEPRRQDLQRDLASQFRVARAIHLSHAAHTQQTQGCVGADLPPDLRRELIRQSRRMPYILRISSDRCSCQARGLIRFSASVRRFGLGSGGTMHKRTFIWVLVIVFLHCLSSTTARAAQSTNGGEYTGTWSGTWDGSGSGNFELTLEKAKDGGTAGKVAVTTEQGNYKADPKSRSFGANQVNGSHELHPDP